MTFPLANQVVVVTGGAVRLGRAIALECARAGANVAITYRTSHDQARQTVTDLEQAAQEVKSPASAFKAFVVDVSRGADVERLVGDVQKHFGPATALVNSAAIFQRTPFSQMNEADFDAHIATNLKGPYLMCKAFGDVFLRAGGGAIVNIADIHGLRPLKNYVPYCVSKAGVVMLTQALALALAPTVRVNCLCPGTILPPSQTQGENDDIEVLKKRIPLGRLGTPEEIAQTVLFLLSGPQFLSGAILPLDGAEHLR